MATVTTYYRKPKDIPAICEALAEHYEAAASVSPSLLEFRNRLIGKSNWHAVWTELSVSELSDAARAVDPSYEQKTWDDAFAIPGAPRTQQIRLALYAPKRGSNYLACTARTKLTHLHERFHWLAHYSNLLRKYPAASTAGDFVLDEYLVEASVGDPGSWRDERAFVFDEMPYSRRAMQSTIAAYEAERVGAYASLYRTINELVIKPLEDVGVHNADVRPAFLPHRLKGPGFTATELELLGTVPALQPMMLAENMHEQVRERMLNNYRMIQKDAS